jgi:hypothetical protein
VGAALVAVVDRARRRVTLDPGVRPGARLAYDGEAVLLHTTSLGHAGETASYLAGLLRRSGWSVTVTPVDEAPAVVVTPLGPAMMPDAAVDALMVQIGPAAGYPLAEQKPKRAYQPRGGGRLFVCLTCGHATRGSHHWVSHVRNRGHHEYRRLPEAEALALQAQVRLGCARGGAPEGQEAPPAASG